MSWLLQFTVRQDEAKQNRKLPTIAFFDTDGNPFNFDQAPVDLTPYARLDGAHFTGALQVDGALTDADGDPFLTQAVVARASANFSTASLTANASENDAVTLPRQAKLYSITTNRPARVRAYSTSAHRTADASRAVGTDPTGNHGCLLDLVTTGSMLTVDLSPMVDLCNLDSPIADTIYFAVQNLDTGAGIVTTTLTYRREE